MSDHTILVTGAGGGLGSTAAVALAGQGAHIILLDKSIPKLEAVYDRIKANGGPEPILYPFDLAGASESDYRELADAVDNKYGSLQGLLHTAAEFTGFTPLQQIETRDWGHSLNVNLNAPFLLTRELLPVLKKGTRASVVFILDSAVQTAHAYTGAYGIAKAGLTNLAMILAAELEPFHNIGVNLLVPGPVDSPLRRRAYPAEDKSKLPALDSLEPAFIYLFGPDSNGVTGQIIDARTFHL